MPNFHQILIKIVLVLFTLMTVKGQSTVFEGGESGYSCFRIPAITEVNNKLIAFAEGRRNSCSDFGDVDIVMKTSDDLGENWSELKVIVNNSSLQAGNPAPVYDVKDPHNPDGRLFLFYNTGTASEAEIVSGKGVRETWFITSLDGGQGWSEPQNITTQVHRPFEPEYNTSYSFQEDWRHHALTPGHGIQLASGRLYIPINVSVGEVLNGKIPYRAGAFYSDDHGDSFQIANLLEQPGSNECTAVELSNGEVILNARDQTEKTGKRFTARSTNQGQSWDMEAVDSFLTDPVCQGSFEIIRGKKNDLVLLSQVFHSTKRENLSLHLSKDGAKTWFKTMTIDSGSSAYSDLVVLSKNRVGVLYEKNNYQRIVFKVIKL